MTLKELSQLYYLKWEIRMDEQRIEELRTLAGKTTQTLSNMPKGPGVPDKMAKYVAAIVDLETDIADKRQKCMDERARLEGYIHGIEDSQTRQIFTLRFVDGLSWLKVARRVGNYATEAYVRNRCYQHLKQER